MNLTSSAETITCAKPGCGAAITLAESVYVDGCGRICRGCDEEFGPCPPWWNDIEPPFWGREPLRAPARGLRCAVLVVSQALRPTPARFPYWLGSAGTSAGSRAAITGDRPGRDRRGRNRRTAGCPPGNGRARKW